MTDDGLVMIGPNGETVYYPSVEAWQEAMAASEREANSLLALAQQQIDWGSYWARFYDVANRIVIFGHVPTLEQIRQTEVEACHGDLHDLAQVDSTMWQIRERKQRGYLFGQAYSVMEPEGEWGDTHVSHCWPISDRLFEAAQAAEWNIDALEEAYKFAISEVWVQWRKHVKWVQQQASRNGR